MFVRFWRSSWNFLLKQIHSRIVPTSATTFHSNIKIVENTTMHSSDPSMIVIFAFSELLSAHVPSISHLRNIWAFSYRKRRAYNKSMKISTVAVFHFAFHTIISQVYVDAFPTIPTRLQLWASELGKIVGKWKLWGEIVLFISFTLHKRSELYVVVIEERGKVQCECRKCVHEVVHEKFIFGGNRFSMPFSYVPATVPMCLFAHTEGFGCITKIPFVFIQWRLLEFTWKFLFLEGNREERDSRRIRVFIGGKGGFWGIDFIVGSIFFLLW